MRRRRSEDLPNIFAGDQGEVKASLMPVSERKNSHAADSMIRQMTKYLG